jgi:hypothetical protein
MSFIAFSGARLIAAVVSSVLVLAGCGGGGGGGGGTGVVKSPPPRPPLPTTSLASDSGRTSLLYMTVQLVVNDAVWDATHGLIHVVTAANSPANASSIVSLDPKTGLVQATHLLSGEPKSIALSADGQYIYAGLSKGGGVVRVHTSGLASDISMPVGTATSTVLQIRVSPTSPTTIAVIVDMLAPADGSYAGIELFDDAVLRPAILHGVITGPPSPGLFVSASDLHWSADATTINATMTVSAGVATLAVAASGVTVTDFQLWPIRMPGRIDGTRIYLDDGRVIDFAGPVQQPGRFADYNNSSTARAELLANQKTFSAQDHLFESQFGPSIDGMTWNAFDANTFAIIDTITFKGLVNAKYGKLITWGANGLAWADADGFVIASGSFAEQGGGAAQAAAPAVVATGSFTGSNGAVNFTVLNFGANDVAADSCNHLYIATSATSAFRPNSVVAYDVPSGTVTGSAYAGSEPYFLAASDDCTAVYAALYYSNSIARLSAPSLAIETVLPLNGGSASLFPFAIGRSIGVAPGARNTIAIARASMQMFLCGDGDLGITVFDGAIERPVIYDSGVYGIKSIVWGSTASSLYGEDSEQALYSLATDSTGVTGATTLNAAIHPSQADVNIGMDLYFDRVTNHLYDSFGRGFDTVNATPFGPLALPTPTATDSCGTPLGGRTTDPTSGKLFYVNYNQGSGPQGILSLASFDGKTLALIDQAQLAETPIPTDYGAPVRVVRLPPDRLAFVTNSGNLVIFEGPMLSP